jgi:hypothetical protein
VTSGMLTGLEDFEVFSLELVEWDDEATYWHLMDFSQHRLQLGFFPLQRNCIPA